MFSLFQVFANTEGFNPRSSSDTRRNKLVEPKGREYRGLLVLGSLLEWKPSPEIQQFLRLTSLIGFIVVATFIINLNFKTFRKVFKEKTSHYWWLFLLFALIPLMLIIYVFSLLFE